MSAGALIVTCLSGVRQADIGYRMQACSYGKMSLKAPEVPSESTCLPSMSVLTLQADPQDGPDHRLRLRPYEKGTLPTRGLERTLADIDEHRPTRTFVLFDGPVLQFVECSGNGPAVSRRHTLSALRCHCCICHKGSVLCPAEFPMGYTMPAFDVQLVSGECRELCLATRVLTRLHLRGNLPTAIVQSVGTDTPFNPATDPTSVLHDCRDFASVTR